MSVMTPEDVPNFIDHSSMDVLVNKLIELTQDPNPSSIEVLKAFLLYKDSDTYSKHVTPRLACMALIQKGVTGIRALMEVLPNAPGSIYPISIVESLWFASKGENPTGTLADLAQPPTPLINKPSLEAQQSSKKAFFDFISESFVNDDYFDILIQFLFQKNLADNIKGKLVDQRKEIFNVIFEGNIRLSPNLIESFKNLIEKEESENIYQIFLTNHPVFIDPLASLVIPKQKLGIEFVSDFVIRRRDDKYIIVEIEKPQDRIFTSADDFNSKFTHALGQVLDFQQWVEANGNYARNLMPQISSPKGLLIMGRKKDLTDRQRQKLHRFNVNSNSIEVLTFDDLLEQALKIYQNLHSK